MTPGPPLLDTALRHHQAGDYPRAEQLYRQALEAHPDNADAWCLLGALYLALGRMADGEASLRRALQLVPNHAGAHDNLGVALARQDRLPEAAASLHAALGLDPDRAETRNNLALVLEKQGKLDEALACLEPALRRQPVLADTCARQAGILGKLGRWAEAATSYAQAVRLSPNNAAYHDSLGVALTRLGKFQEATASYREALRLRPNHAPTHNKLGLALSRMGRCVEAVASYEQALRLKPDDAETLNNLGVGLMDLGRLDEAATTLRQALRLRPDYAMAHNNLGSVLAAQGHFEESAASHERALQTNPDDPDALNNLGSVRTQQGRFDEAMSCFDRALRLRPDDPEAHHNRALVRITQDNYEEGWAEFEWRWKCRAFAPHPFPQPLWDGSPLHGRTILLHTEQGLGDTFQFIRYAPLVKQRGGTVLLGCPKAVIPVLSGCAGIDRCIGELSDFSGFDVHAPLLSLPHIFGTTLATVPVNVPYLSAQADLVEHWRRELAGLAGFQVGVVWQGSPKYRGDRQRSIPLRYFEPLARLPGVRLISLQKGLGTEQIAQVSDRFEVVDLGSRLDEEHGAFVDTAAVLKNLDLLVTCDTAVGHLAGALGVPFWVAQPYAPDWRWGLGREGSPWYATVRLFRQATPGDWDGVFARIAEALWQRLAEGGTTLPVVVEVAPGELIDKITILEIKSERIADAAKLASVRRELQTLSQAREGAVRPRPELHQLAAELRAVNEALWEIEDAIRLCERDQDFGQRFVELARSVYKHNDRRAALKRKINELLGSQLIEEKAYTTST